MTNPQPRTPGHRTPLPGPPDQRSHHEGAVTQALHRHLTKHTESPMEAAAHLQLEAVRRAAAEMVHRKHLLLTHAEQLADLTAREHMQRLIHYHALHDPDVH